mmetsp:Transcript_59649/g.106023  ORF Transcript_59649/g.106023 Transcript_59649/m.106023 type:complete len:215 (-) Transcript_59649:235-879(-)
MSRHRALRIFLISTARSCLSVPTVPISTLPLPPGMGMLAQLHAADSALPSSLQARTGTTLPLHRLCGVVITGVERPRRSTAARRAWAASAVPKAAFCAPTLSMAKRLMLASYRWLSRAAMKPVKSKLSLGIFVHMQAMKLGVRPVEERRTITDSRTTSTSPVHRVVSTTISLCGHQWSARERSVPSLLAQKQHALYLNDEATACTRWELFSISC